MKITSYTLLRNDAELIEPFVRHHCGIIESMCFIDDRSTDDTLRILDCLRKEGLPVVLLPPERPYATWEYERQLERVRAEKSNDHILPLHVNEYLLKDSEAADFRPSFDAMELPGWEIPCSVMGFPGDIENVPPVFRKVRAPAETSATRILPGWRIIEVPSFSAAVYKVKSCIYTLDGLAGRRGDFCNLALWQEAFEKLKSDPIEAAVALPQEETILAELGLMLQKRRYPVRSKGLAEVTADILEFCEHFADVYRRRTLQKWPETAGPARLDSIEREIDILLRTRSWRLTRPLRRIEKRLRRYMGLQSDEL